MKNKLYLSLVIVALLCLVGWTGYAQGQRTIPGRQIQEYRVVDAYNDSDQAERALNRYGAEGWEFVSRGGDYYYFKRAR